MHLGRPDRRHATFGEQLDQRVLAALQLPAAQVDHHGVSGLSTVGSSSTVRRVTSVCCARSAGSISACAAAFVFCAAALAATLGGAAMVGSISASARGASAAMFNSSSE